MIRRMRKQKNSVETAETLARGQREISVSEFFLKNRHLLGFDNPRKALLTTVKEAVDNALDACEEAGILPEVSVDIAQTGESRFRVSVTDNGPGIVKSQIPRIFAKLLYGSKFHRLRMSRGQQGIGISAAGMYGQLTTGGATQILSRTGAKARAHSMSVHVDTRRNQPEVLKDEECDWLPQFFAAAPDGAAAEPATYSHGTCVSIEMEAAYVRGRLSVDEYLRQCAVVNPHLQLHYRVSLLSRETVKAAEDDDTGIPAPAPEEGWTTRHRAVNAAPDLPREIKPHPHGVELGMLMQMLKDTKARNLRSALHQDFSRVSNAVALQICSDAGLEPNARPSRIATGEIEALYNAISRAKLMRPPPIASRPIGEEAIEAGLRKEIGADFYTAVTRAPAVYRGNPFQIEAGLAYARQGSGNKEMAADDSARLMRFANRVPLLSMAGACSITKAASGVNWKAYGLPQPRGSLPVGPMVILVHMASVWVPFTSESKEAVAHYPEIMREITFALQECGRRLSAYLGKRRRQDEAERKRNYMELYIPHLALGLKEVLDLPDREEEKIVSQLRTILDRTHLQI